MVFTPRSSSESPVETTASGRELGHEELAKMSNFERVLHFVQENNWTEAMGAVMALYTEYFGTDEEKQELAKARQEAQEDQTKRDTHSALDELHTEVDEEKKDEDESPKDGKQEKVTETPAQDPTPRFSSKAELEPQVQAIYAERGRAAFTVANLHEMFRDPTRYIIHEDPITHEKISFLGREVSGGINMIMLPYLKMAEAELRSIGFQYQPRAENVMGYQNRNMKLIGQGLSPNIPSFHKYGLAIDIDPSQNGPEDGRGDIPDQVILVMARAGFTCGLFRTEDAPYLGQDPMHFQLEYPPDSDVGRGIIAGSEIGQRYMAAIQPMAAQSEQRIA